MGASLCQYVALHLQLAHLPAQPGQFLALGAAQAFLARQRAALVTGGLRHPVEDGLRRAFELARQLGRRLASVHQLDHLLAKCRWVGRLGLGHLGLLLSRA
jgi:hypothetical protein